MNGHWYNMAHYAILDENNIVIRVLSGVDEGTEGKDWEAIYKGKRTSYNTSGGVYYDPETNLPHVDQSKAFRKNYAGIGYSYDPVRDAFIPPKDFPSWVLNEQTCLWEAPIPRPNDDKAYFWDESTTSWKLIS